MEREIVSDVLWWKAPSTHQLILKARPSTLLQPFLHRADACM